MEVETRFYRILRDSREYLRRAEYRRKKRTKMRVQRIEHSLYVPIGVVYDTCTPVYQLIPYKRDLNFTNATIRSNSRRRRISLLARCGRSRNSPDPSEPNRNYRGKLTKSQPKSFLDSKRPLDSARIYRVDGSSEEKRKDCLSRFNARLARRDTFFLSFPLLSSVLFLFFLFLFFKNV